MKRIAFIAMAAALTGCQTGPEQLASQRPVTPEIRQNIAQAARTTLRDPYSVRDAEISSVMGKGINTYVCVRANTKNGFGGYVGKTGYIIPLNNNRPTNVFENNAWCNEPAIKYERFTELENLKNL
ncbi:hypothetical protein HJA82_29705 [Rhizobium bangladeshense]|uniref:hypothetical protein n=1 Tax=Rhizobium bangladeshense TaxID=1138189 RepID=UPI001C82C69F|nr:hypothetical protein [Rhizobium bangladeshense]MBX4911493.1 hypothetical protein [Rhizobium bangladeshense]